MWRTGAGKIGLRLNFLFHHLIWIVIIFNLSLKSRAVLGYQRWECGVVVKLGFPVDDSCCDISSRHYEIKMIRKQPMEI